MKKTCTFLAAVFLISFAAFAQNNGNHWGNNNNGNNDPYDVNMDRNRDDDYHDNGKYYYSDREKDWQIEQINREYNSKIQSVRNRFFMSRYQKERIITSLLFQRDNEIRSVMAKYKHRKYRHDQRDNRYRDHDKRDWD